MVFNTPTYAYLDFGFDGLNSLNFVLFFPKFPNGLCCRLTLRALWSLQQLLSITAPNITIPETCRSPNLSVKEV